MKRILINATHNEEIRVALCKDNHLYDFDLENRTREQKKANIYKGHITRVEPSLEAAFVEYGSARQGFLPLREIAPEYLRGNLREDNIKQLLKEGDEVIVQVEKEERGNKGAALSTYISLAGRYLVLMPNNSKAGGISRQISGKVREEMKQIISSLSIPKGMSVIVRTAGLGKGFDDLQNDLNHLLDIWTSILDQNKKRPSPCLVHQEAGVVTRAVRDYLRDDISEVWIDSENAYNEAANFIAAVMPTQMGKLRKYTEYEPMFARFGIERQIETAYQREVRLPSGGSIVIDQTEAMVAIDINSSKSTKGSDVSETAYHTNLEAADEIARQLRLRDMGGLIVIDFIDMADARHQKDVEKRLIDATRHDRARVQFAEISKFGLMEMSRQRLRPSLEESTGYICPRCHGNGMIRDLRSLALSIMRQIEQIALKERMGEIQAEVPTEIAAFLLNEKRESLVYLEQDSGTRITILPHAHLESPNFSLHFNPDGFAPSSYERIAHAEEEEMGDRGYDVDWHTEEQINQSAPNRWQKAHSAEQKREKSSNDTAKPSENKAEPQIAAWLSNLFAPKPQAQLASSLNSSNAAAAIESLVNAGGVSLGASGVASLPAQISADKDSKENRPAKEQPKADKDSKDDNQERRNKNKKPVKKDSTDDVKVEKTDKKAKKDETSYPKRESGSQRPARSEVVRKETLTAENKTDKTESKADHQTSERKKTDKERTRHSSPDEVVVNITPAVKAPEVSQAVHISLDGSKPTAKNEVQEVSTDEPAIAVAVLEDIPADAPAVKSADESLADNEVSTVITDNHDKNADAQLVQVEQENTSTSSSAQVPNARLAELAQQMNKAINDPRVVAAAQSTPAITGAAGEFIERTLGADKGDDFIKNFITACAKARASTSEFSFANYGYAKLGEDYLAAFDKQTSVASRISAPQGKSDAPPLRITRRAANDPRGQHPDFIEPSEVKSDTESEVALQTVETHEAASHTPMVNVDEVNTVAHDSDILLDTQAHLHDDISEPSVNSDTTQTADATDEIVENTQDKEETLVEQVKEGLESAVQAIANTVNDLFGDDEIIDTKPNDDAKQSAEVENSKEADDGKKTKKRANSYKDMIENVAGQLLPQVGILNLAQPKPAKTRIKKTASKGDNKPKSEVRKAGAKISKAKTDKPEPQE